MKYSNWFKGFLFLAFACSVTVQGSNSYAYGMYDFMQSGDPSMGYQIAVSAGKAQDTPADANLTISGENSKVSIEEKGTVTLVAGKSIVLHPGTKISKGSFLYASIGSKSKTGKLHKKEVKLVTVEENQKLLEQASLATAFELFCAVPVRKAARLHAGAAEQGSYQSSNYKLSGVCPEQQRKVAVESQIVAATGRLQTALMFNTVAVSSGHRPEATRVLRL